jgi:transposase InsO family protein
VSTQLSRQGCSKAMAITGGHAPPKVIFHSDRGCQYTSHEFARFCAGNKIQASVGRTGVCWDCAAAESFFATLKNEMYYRHRFDTRARARFAVAEYIEIFYNRRRLHSRHGYRTRPKPSAITRPEQQPDHDNHEELSTILDTAHTAWIWHFRFDRSPTSFARWRTQPRSSRVAGGAIQASGSRPIHSKSARSAASRSSFFTRCNANIFTPGGLA